jgi:hypothetical protein
MFRPSSGSPPVHMILIDGTESTGTDSIEPSDWHENAPSLCRLSSGTDSKLNLESTSRFFTSVPELDNNTIVLDFQNKFIDRILSVSLQYENVLYCISNEAREPERAWNHYWAGFIGEIATRAGRSIELTDMYWQPDLLGEKHKRVYGRPDLFSFSEVSQNSACNRDENWENLAGFRGHIEGKADWPLNSVKIYGSVQKRHTGMMGSEQDAIEKFFRNLLGGCASSRFHRPPSGLGLGDLAKQCIISARLIENETRFWDMVPCGDLLVNRGENAAYLAADPGKAYVLFMPYEGASVGLDLGAHSSRYRIRWLDIHRRSWQAEGEARGGAVAEIVKPGTGNWIGLITAV